MPFSTARRPDSLRVRLLAVNQDRDCALEQIGRHDGPGHLRHDYSMPTTSLSSVFSVTSASGPSVM